MILQNIKKYFPSGFSLIEILVALFILSFGLLGIAQLELTALQKNRENFEYSLAITQLEAMAERLRANQSNEAQMRECELWRSETRDLLVGAKTLCQCNLQSCQIALNWKTHHLAWLINI